MCLMLEKFRTNIKDISMFDVKQEKRTVDVAYKVAKLLL